jgi:predicted acylesterase/phospholipase RssA
VKRTSQKKESDFRLKTLYKRNLDYINSIYLSFKDKNIPKYLKKLQESIEKEIFTAKKIKDYVYNLYYYPDENYENVNQPVDRNVLGERIALVLSGGGARGAAHAGVLKVLENNGIKPAFIIGTSVGSIVGAVYSAGISPDEMIEIFEKEEKKFFKLSYYRYISQWTMTHILRSILKRYLPLNKVENTKIPFYINATDLKRCERLIFSTGDLTELVIASSAIPFLFEPINYEDYILVDGGVTDNFCVDIARIINKNDFNDELKIVISDVSAATDFTSSINAPHFLLNLSRGFVDTVKLVGKEIYPVRDKRDVLSIINNILYMLDRRGGLAPELSGDEIIITPMLENMGVFEFKKCRWAFNKGVETANIVLQ